jgi:hypothetical protein
MHLLYFSLKKLMKITITISKYLLITILIFVAWQQKGYASGFPVRPGKLILSPSLNYFKANKGWDSVRNLAPFQKDGRFTSLSYSLYAEYGISKRFTFVALLPYVVNNYEQSDYKSHTQGVTDLETGIKYYLANINYIYYFSLQGTFITPLYTNENLGYAKNGAEIKLSFAGSGKLFGKNDYFTIDNAIRRYFDGTGPLQYRYSGTFGLTLDRRFKHQVSVSVGGFYSTSSFTKFNPIQPANKNFAFNQASFSYGYAITKKVSIFLTAGTFLNGRNTGDGSSLSSSLVLRP